MACGLHGRRRGSGQTGGCHRPTRATADLMMILQSVLLASLLRFGSHLTVVSLMNTVGICRKVTKKQDNINCELREKDEYIATTSLRNLFSNKERKIVAGLVCAVHVQLTRRTPCDQQFRRLHRVTFTYMSDVWAMPLVCRWTNSPLG